MGRCGHAVCQSNSRCQVARLAALGRGVSVSAKVNRANGRRDGAIAAPQAGPVAKSQEGIDEIDAELADATAALSEDEDVFSEVPTVANRANPTASPREIDKESGEGRAGAGAYRMVHPATLDRIAVPVPAAPQRAVAKRVVIGVTRKSQ